jgi:hypothetical protein
MRKEDDNEDLSGLLVMARSVLQIEVQLYTVITAMNKAKRRLTVYTTKLLSPITRLGRSMQSRRLHLLKALTLAT